MSVLYNQPNDAPESARDARADLRAFALELPEARATSPSARVHGFTRTELIATDGGTVITAWIT